jgi:hypothetical protein
VILISRLTGTRELQRIFKIFSGFSGRHTGCLSANDIEIVLVALGVGNLDCVGSYERRWTDQIIFEDRQTRTVWRRNTTHASGRVGLQNWTVNWSDKGGGSQLQPDPVSARVVRVTNAEFQFL